MEVYNNLAFCISLQLPAPFPPVNPSSLLFSRLSLTSRLLSWRFFLCVSQVSEHPRKVETENVGDGANHSLHAPSPIVFCFDHSRGCIAYFANHRTKRKHKKTARYAG